MLTASFCLSLGVLASAATGYVVSFYGNSFLFQSIASSNQNTTTVSLQFHTSSSDGILLYALGRLQFFLIEMINGRLEVRMDLGFGEEIISTSEYGRLNNQIWHEVKFSLSGGTGKVVINKRDMATGQIPVPDRRAIFNYDFGVFLGGLGGNVTLRDGHYPKFFRGCMLEAKIDGTNLLANLRSRRNKVVSYNVLPGCPKVFRASRSESVTFDSPSAFVALKRWTTLDEGTFQCMLKTTGRNGIILYNAGYDRGEFIGLEMEDGVVGASMNKGAGIVALHSTSAVNDGSWHSVRFSFSPSFLDISVDGERTKVFIERTELNKPEEKAGTGLHRSLDLTSYLYIGGILDSLLDENAVPQNPKSLRFSQGKAAIGVAFPGCMKNLRVNHRRKGFGDFVISNKVSVGCDTRNWDNKDVKWDIDGYREANTAISKLFALFNWSTLQPTTTTMENAVTTAQITTKPVFLLPVLRITTGALTVHEGKSATLSEEQLFFHASSTRSFSGESEILFVVSGSAVHGYISKSGTCSSRHEAFEFSWNDVTSSRISYCHDGSEILHDQFNFTVVWDLANRSLRERKIIITRLAADTKFVRTGIALNGGRNYSIPVSVIGSDDPPELHITADFLFRPIKHVATYLPRHILNASDADSNRDKIFYTILGNDESEEFRLEILGCPGQSIVQFTQLDVDLLKVTYTHTGHRNNTRLFMRVSNLAAASNSLMQDSPTSILRISAVLLNISVTVKSVTMLEKSSFIFTTDYLSITSNALNSSVEFLCKIGKTPNLGVVEIKSGSGWSETGEYTLGDIESGFVRYRNVPGEAGDLDSFDFSVHAAGVESKKITFLIELLKADVNFSAKPIVLNNGLQEKQIAGSDFFINIANVVTANCRIQLLMNKTLQCLEFFYIDNGLVLLDGDIITLDEVKTGRVSVKVIQKCVASAFQEMIPVQASVNDIYMSRTEQWNITYVPASERILLVNKGLDLDEGQQQAITTKMLKASLPPNIINDTIKYFQFIVMEIPIHGLLIFSDGGYLKKLGEANSANVVNFSSVDLEHGRLHYRHDDSETALDHFSFCVAPILNGRHSPTIIKLPMMHLCANFSFRINLVNDERPVRVIERAFEIARSSERLLTEDDFWYNDADSNYDDLDISVIRRGITNGDILNATSSRHEKIFRFTQRQIRNGEVLLKHWGEDFGRFVFRVTDGKYYVTGLFTISASEPFVMVINSATLSVIRGKSAILTGENLLSKANTKGRAKDIEYRLTKPLQSGSLFLKSVSGNSSQPASIFTQQDINDGIVVYTHGGFSMADDVLNFRVSAGQVFREENLSVKVYLESRQKPPIVQNNHKIIVAQGEKVQIRKQDLRVVHPDVRSSDIMFSIICYPFLGNLKFVSDGETQEFTSATLTEFTQSDINRGSVWYAQNKSMAYGHLNFTGGVLLDRFTFNVTNQVLSVDNLTFYFDIVPNRIPLRLGNFSVTEGRSKAMVNEYLRIDGSHFEDTAVEIKIVTPPTYGFFESTQQINVPLKSFNYGLAEAEFLYYVHDGSNSLQDKFSLQAITLDGKVQSYVHVAYVNVIPENDEIPVIVNNTGLNVWSNSVTELPSISLYVHDLDTTPEYINYRILPPSNGWIAFGVNPQNPIFNFTQMDIDENRIVFVHQGATTGGFTFQVDDGVNFATKSIFVVTAKPLTITLKGTQTILAFPGRLSPIFSSTIQSSTNDRSDTVRIITYIITTQPKFGKLVKKVESSLGPYSYATKLTHFTQMDVNNELLAFKQDASFERWSQVDNFVVTATSAPASNITDINILVNITYDASIVIGKSTPVEVNKGCTVIEGGKFVINTTFLNAGNLYKKLPPHKDRKHYKLIYVFTKLPVHGRISIAGRNVAKVNTSFSQLTLEANKVEYSHDHSDTNKDYFAFDVYLTDKRFSASTGQGWVVPGTYFQDTFNVTVTPLNDNSPMLLTKHKFLEVVSGIEAIISSSVLKAVDADNAPDEVVYSIIRRPSKGNVVFAFDKEIFITKFTQKDVNNGKVAFVPHVINMTRATIEDAFYYGLTDGIQRLAYNLLKIKIVPVSLDFHPNSIEIIQGLFSSVLTPAVLNASTNGNYSRITFQIEQNAQNGMIMLDEEMSDVFTYEQLERNKVAFAMTDMTVSEDYMKLTANYNGSSAANLSLSASVKILVTPLIIKGSLFACNHGLTRIELSALNATTLFIKTNSMPIYTVISKPDYGQILKATPHVQFMRSRRDLNRLPAVLVEVEEFLHEDVVGGCMFLYMENLNITNSSTKASIGLRLTVADELVQPAEFVFDFGIIEAEPQDYSAFFEQFLPNVKEVTSEVKIKNEIQQSSTLTGVSTGSSPISKLTEKTSQNLKEEKVRENTDETDTIDHRGSTPYGSQPAESSLSWLIPVTVTLVLILATALGVVFAKRFHWCRWKNYNKRQQYSSEEICSMTRQEDRQKKIGVINHVDNKVANDLLNEPFRSPAWPGVTVTLLKNDSRPESKELAHDGKDLCVVQQSQLCNRDNSSSTACLPSTVHHYVDGTSVNFTDAIEVEFCAANRAVCSDEKLHHLRSAKYLDPDVLELYSSDESIPSIINEKYAAPYHGVNMVTVSVPSGLHRAATGDDSRVKVKSTGSTASLSQPAISPELSLLPNSGFESNQYWI